MLPDRVYSPTASTIPAPVDPTSDVFRVASSTLPKPPARPTIWSWPKRCNKCGRSFSAAEWAQLPDRAIWDMRADGGDLLEQRSCVCTSSICVTLEE